MICVWIEAYLCLQIYMLFHKSDEQLRSCLDKAPERNQVDDELQQKQDSNRRENIHEHMMCFTYAHLINISVIQ